MSQIKNFVQQNVLRVTAESIVTANLKNVQEQSSAEKKQLRLYNAQGFLGKLFRAATERQRITQGRGQKWVHLLEKTPQLSKKVVETLIEDTRIARCTWRSPTKGQVEKAYATFVSARSTYHARSDDDE